MLGVRCWMFDVRLLEREITNIQHPTSNTEHRSSGAGPTPQPVHGHPLRPSPEQSAIRIPHSAITPALHYDATHALPPPRQHAFQGFGNRAGLLAARWGGLGGRAGRGGARDPARGYGRWGELF